MGFGAAERSEGFWWTVPYDGEPAIKMFLPLKTDLEDPVILIWQGFAAPRPVLQFVNTVANSLQIHEIEDLIETASERMTSESALGGFLEIHAAPGGHFFIAVQGEMNGRHEELRIWGDGPRSRGQGLTPELGLGLRPALLEMAPIVAAIAPFVGATLHWNPPEDEIHRVIRELVEAQAEISHRWWARNYA